MAKVCIFVAQDVQYEEFIYPYQRFLDEGLDVEVLLAPKSKYPKPTAKNGTELFWDKTCQEVVDSGKLLYDLVYIPGGFAPEVMRLDPELLCITRYNIEKNSLIAAICHGTQVLLSCRNIPKNTRMTGYPGIKHDIENAGYIYSLYNVIVEQNIITGSHYKYNEIFVDTVLQKLNNRDNSVSYLNKAGFESHNFEFSHNKTAT